MKEKWRQFNKWRQGIFLKNWPRTRERGKLVFVIKTIFFWTMWMTGWSIMFDKYFSGRETNIILTAIIFSVIGIILGLISWGENEKYFQKLSATNETQK